jgi:hypothetical protein
MSQSQKEIENRPLTPFPPADREDWELQFRNQLQALSISQGDQGGQGYEQVPIVSRTESNTQLMHPTPIRPSINQQTPSFHPERLSQARPGHFRNLTEGVWIDNKTREQIAPHINSPTHIGPSPLGNSVGDRGDDEEIEKLISLIAAAFHEQEEATHTTALHRQNMRTRPGRQGHGSDNSRTDTGRRRLGDVGLRDTDNRMDES